MSWMRIIFAASLCFAMSAQAATLHISPTGDDDAAGTTEKPFATLERARDEARRLRRDQKVTEPLDIVVHPGTYALTATLELGPEDSSVIWHAAEKDKVFVTGGPALPASAFTTVTDDAILARLSTTARGKVVRLDLAALGKLDLGDYPDTFRGVPAAPELFFNDQRMTVARWPNSGWATVAKIVESGSVPREGDTAGKLGVFEYSGDEPSGWNIDAGVWLQGYWCYDWYEQTIRIKSIDRDQKRITLATPAVYGVKQGNPSPRRFRALNVLEELDEPGEFYIDRAHKVLYFWPPATMKDARVSLSTLNAPLLRLKGAHDVVIRGITFQSALADGIEVTGGERNVIDACVVRNTRQLGIRVTGGRQHRVENCDIYDTGSGGLILEGGDRRTLTASHHEAIGNHIHDFSRHQLTAAYGIVLGGVGNRAANNLLHDAPHQAVFFAGNDHVFEFNIVRNVVTETDDAGALYKGRNPSCRGNMIRHNFFSDIGSPMGHGTAAIYFDDGDGGDTVFGNIFVRCGSPGGGGFGTVFSHGGHGLRAENNIFIDCQRALGSVPWDDARWKDATQGGQDCNWQTLLLKEVDITKPPYTTRYPELVGFMDPQPGQERSSHAKNNVMVRCAEATGGNWKSAANEMWMTDQDPGFVDMAGKNYQLRVDAEVFKHLPEFKPIPFEKIGPQRR